MSLPPFDLDALQGVGFLGAHARFIREGRPITPVLLFPRAEFTMVAFPGEPETMVTLARSRRDTVVQGSSAPWTALVYEVVLNAEDGGKLDGFVVEWTDAERPGIHMLVWPWELQDGELVLFAPRLDDGRTNATQDEAAALRYGMDAHNTFVREKLGRGERQ